MKVLFISNLFPDAEHPNRGIYNAELVTHLARLCDVRVFSPRPTKGFPPVWFPKKYVNRTQDEILKPVFPPASYLPKIGSRLNHFLMARSVRPALKEIRQAFPFDVVLCSWIYPDACAVAELAQGGDFPFVAVAQGSDVHQYLNIPARRKIISVALAKASSVVARSQDLSRQLAAAGIKEDRLQVIYNGVDFRKFLPADRSAIRKVLGFEPDEFVLLFVGNLLPIKNPALLVDAHAWLRRNHPARKFVLRIIGAGPLADKLQERIQTIGTADSVRLEGARPSHEVAQAMQAADLLCVPSDNEGVPNVILEAFACGTRVVARNVGGIPEILSRPFLGKLVDHARPEDMAQAILELSNTAPSPRTIAEHAGQFSWDSTAHQYLKLLEHAANTRC